MKSIHWRGLANLRLWASQAELRHRLFLNLQSMTRICYGAVFKAASVAGSSLRDRPRTDQSDIHQITRLMLHFNICEAIYHTVAFIKWQGLILIAQRRLGVLVRAQRLERQVAQRISTSFGDRKAVNPLRSRLRLEAPGQRHDPPGSRLFSASGAKGPIGEPTG